MRILPDINVNALPYLQLMRDVGRISASAFRRTVRLINILHRHP
ncbi:hypothetical protein A464_4239 [Salmonella bongori N268-08]|uniref:Uncharacterized protein n=1 Tax=Salmonella bongori N268-08 TaxID=1197719 RepID=S5NMD4_SALBN|nr:hypothetical protein A464_4239 [Salmonella bongori N268-08]